MDDGQKVAGIALVTDEEEDHVVALTRGGWGLAYKAKFVPVKQKAGKGVKCMTMTLGDSLLTAGITTGAQGSIKVVSSKGTESSWRHTKLKPKTRGGVGKALMSRDRFVSVVREVVEV